MFFAFAFVLFLAYLMLADFMDTSSSGSVPSQENTTPRRYEPHFQDPYREPSYQHRPIFSPDRRHFWDGEKWMPNRPNNNFGAGVIVGLLLAAVLVYCLFRYSQ